MRVDLISREYPPEVYGGAGVHVAELVRALRPHLDVVVRCFGQPRDEQGTYSYLVPPGLTTANPALATLGVDLQIAQDVGGADIVHSHTWYANGAGHVASLLHGIPHVVTAHSLEPLRPWKAEQLGGGYRVSSWIEATAFAGAARIIAVSEGMRQDILRSYAFLDPARVSVVYNGIDLERWHPVDDEELVRGLGIDPTRPSVVFVGRITRQKGLPYLLKAAALLPKEVQLVLCAGAPDTPQILAEWLAREPRIRVLTQVPNQGYSKALIRGFYSAQKDVVFYTDADAQFDLREIVRLHPHLKDHDMVCGYRVGRKDPPIRFVTSFTFNMLQSLILGTSARDVNCAFKLFRKSFFEKVKLDSDGFLIDAEIYLRAKKAGLTFTQLGVTHRPRTMGSTTVKLKTVTDTLRQLWQLRRSV